MPQTSHDPDPYAELEYRADAAELSDEYRKPVRTRLRPPHLPMTRTGTGRPRRRGV